MRSKEEAQDYRYFPDPDLPPLVLDEAFVAQVRAGMPELPSAKRRRFVDEMGLSPYAAQVMTGHPRVAAFFEEAATLHGNPAKVANFVQSEVLRDVATRGLKATIPLMPAQLAQLLKLVDAGTISGKQAKEVYGKVAGTNRDPEEVVVQLGIQQVSDAGAIEAICKRLIEQNPKQANQLRAGKGNVLGFFVGMVMKETKGAANPQLVNEVLKKLLGTE
jgi:aspartyl-tRNA(Asn)/glutamyl-tRNA(Gln) amidotransferase subunit B